MEKKMTKKVTEGSVIRVEDSHDEKEEVVKAPTPKKEKGKDPLDGVDINALKRMLKAFTPM